MELFVPFPRMVAVVAMAMVLLVLPVYGQISTPCTASMLSSLTPCMNFLTNSTSNGTSPTADCCSSLKNLTSNGMGCMCLIVTGSVPFSIPINRTLAISLPRACNMPGVPLQCKASSAPVPAPGPVALGPTPPEASPSASPKASVVPPSASAPESDLTQPSSTGTTGVPPSSAGIRPVETPTSAAMPSYSFPSPSLLLFAMGFLVLKHCY